MIWVYFIFSLLGSHIFSFFEILQLKSQRPFHHHYRGITPTQKKILKLKLYMYI
jgi:hypothetical protein